MANSTSLSSNAWIFIKQCFLKSINIRPLSQYEMRCLTDICVKLRFDWIEFVLKHMLLVDGLLVYVKRIQQQSETERQCELAQILFMLQGFVFPTGALFTMPANA